MQPMSVDDRLIYSTDSPLFSKNMHDFQSESAKLVESLKYLIKCMKQFCKDVKNCAKSGNSLAEAIKSDMSSQSYHFQQNVSPILSLFSNVFSEFAHSQQILSESLERAFIVPLELFCSNTLNRFFALQNSYSKEKETYESNLVKYLQNDSSSLFSRSNPQNNSESRALEVVQSLRKFEMTRFDAVRMANQIEAQQSYEISGSCISAMVALRTHHHVCSDRLQSLTSIIKEYSDRQHGQRMAYLQRQIVVDRFRNDIEAVLSSMVERVEAQITPLVPAGTDTPGATTPNAASSPSLSTATTSTNTSTTANVSTSAPSSTNTSSTGAGTGTAANSTQSSLTSALFSNPESIFLPSSNDNTNNSNTNNNNNNTNNTNNSNAPATSGAFSSFGNMKASLMSMGAKFRKASTDSSSTPLSGRNENETSETPMPTAATLEEVEIKMKPLDHSELDPMFVSNPRENFGGVVKQGYVLERTAGKIIQQHVWTRKWLVLDESKLYFVREGDSNGPIDVQIVCDIMLASVRELKTIETPYCFEVAHANIKTYYFQAEGQREYDSWIESIRGAIEKRLTQGAVAQSTSQSMNSAAAKHEHRRRQEAKQLSEELMKANPTCAECGKSDPDWISLNLGCVMCIECSGVHRSLGVHISKVRSLTLDQLETEEYQLLKSLGNVPNHDIWEHEYIEPDAAQKRRYSISSSIDGSSGLDESISSAHDGKDDRLMRPEARDGYSVREKFIRVKYQKRLFLENLLNVLKKGHLITEDKSNTDIDDLTLSKAVVQVCEKDDVVMLANLLAHNILNRCSSMFMSTLSSEDNEDGNKLRHPLLVACERGSIKCAVLLILSGLDVTSSTKVHGDDTSSTQVVPLLKAAMQEASKSGHEALSVYIANKMQAMNMT